MGQDREGFAFGVFVGKPVEVFFPGLIALEEEGCCFREGPLEMGIADLFAASAGLFPVGLLGAFDGPASRRRNPERWGSDGCFRSHRG